MEALLDFMILIELCCLAVMLAVMVLGRRLDARVGTILATLAVGVALGAMLVAVWAEAHDGHVPDHPVGSPGPWPSHGLACAELARVDDLWVYIPEREVE